MGETRPPPPGDVIDDKGEEPASPPSPPTQFSTLPIDDMPKIDQWEWPRTPWPSDLWEFQAMDMWEGDAGTIDTNTALGIGVLLLLLL